MKRVFLLLLLLFFFSRYQTTQAQIDSIQQRIFLIGDAGELSGGKHPVVDWLQTNVNWDDARNTAVYLGDNIYPLGLPMKGESGYEEAKRIIDYQMSLVRGKKSRAFFVQGNHDWKNGMIGGWQRAMTQINYVNGQEQPNLIAQPTDGCPGPEVFELSEKVVLVMMDSQWFLYLHEKPGPGSNCSSKTLDQFATELREIVATHPNQLLVLVMHHPMYSYGVHGGDYSWKEHLFPLTAINPNLYIPLPVLGSVYPVTRGIFGNVQDIKHPLYQQMVNTIAAILKNHPNPIAVAGHDHSLQLIVKDSIPYIVSGSGSNLSRVKSRAKQGNLLFSDLNYGFSLLEVRKSGRVEARFYNLQSKNLEDATFTKELKKIDTLPTKISRDSIPVLPDSIVVIANKKLKGNGFRYFFMGRNYRREWTTPVRVQVLDLGKEQGGLTPEKQGGGKQTRSLRLLDKDGKDWALRSIEKYPENAIPEDLRSPFAKSVVEDGISASYPYAALSIEPLARAAGLPPIRRKLVYIPDDPRLGRFRETFKNTVAVLEEREPLGVKKAYNTDQMVLRLLKDNDNHIDQLAVLKARLLDNFIMDLDRHEDQWQWAPRDTGKGKLYYPIPRDHDQAFYVNQGLLPKFVKKPWFAPELQGFRAEADNIKTFNKAARNFDRFFLNEVDWPVWSNQIDTIVSAMSDDVLMSAIKRQPDEIEHLNAERIRKTLQKRRNHFRKDMQKYYEFISREVNVVGSNQRELFLIQKEDNGNVHVTVHKLNKEGQLATRMYDRVFVPEVTKELNVYGLEDNDSFHIRGQRTPIRIRIVGGPGDDHFVNEDAGDRVHLYDVDFEENRFSGNDQGFDKHVSADPQMNMYNRLFYKYNYVNPGISVGYNIDDGLSLGAQLRIVRQGYRKQPYAAQHFIQARRALRTDSYQFRYQSEFIRLVKNTDLVLRADVRAPVNVTNFFGLGNDSRYDKNHPDKIQYYRARYNYADLSVLFRRQLQSWMKVSYGASYQGFKLKEGQNKNRFVSNTAENGLDPKTLYDAKAYLGGQLGLEINSRTNQVIPTRGFVLDARVQPLFALNASSHNLVKTNIDMRIFASFGSTARLVYAIRFGAGHNFGKFEFPQAQYLSGVENLRGYRRDRFAGRTQLYNNMEVRLKIADFNTYLFPGQIGLFVFNDVGRVWTDNERSSDWHVGNGGGIYIAPIKRFVITAAATRSKEEKLLPYVNFGFQF